MSFSDSCLHLADHRHDQPLVAERGADADIDVVEHLEPVVVPAAVDVGATFIASAAAATMIGGVGELRALLRVGLLVRLRDAR